MEAITREEKIISGENLTPITRKEMFLAKAAGQDVATPTPITREEMFLSKIKGGGTSDDEGVSIVNQIIEGTLAGEYTSEEITKVRNNGFAYCTKLTSVNVPNATSIGAQAFYGDTALKSVNIQGATSIGNNAFYYCSALTSIDIPKITQIESKTFVQCKALTEVVIPETVTGSIKEYSFQNCSSLKTVTFKTKPSSISGNTFSNCTNLITINVPWAEGAVANAPWSAKNATINYNYTEV